MTALIHVQNLRVYFPIYGGVLRKKVAEVRAVDDVTFTIPTGKTMGLVGESGSGKTTLGRAILRLTPVTSGKVTMEGTDFLSLPESDLRARRRHMQMIFQDPYGSLNPRMTVLQIIGEAYEIHFPRLTRADREDRVADLMEKVGLKRDHVSRYPHEFSGGQRQRIGIARALAVDPKFIVCDECVSALDVSVQASIINLLQDLQEQLNLTYLFISHDLAVVEHISHEVMVMHHGKIVEQATAEEIYQSPRHEYTRKLLAAVPTL
ncbi:MAG: ATP-binding cassette domain-containing protein [Verrucomicrobiae bacterium]|nr:ATP-binding cassette domain-containing protein [Verrucomicrobiae bacterium]